LLIGCVRRDTLVDPNSNPNQNMGDIAMDGKQSLFAFKLAAKEDARQASIESKGKWKAHEGAAFAGCTLVKASGEFRGSIGFGRDNGFYC
jgi:hypothetical protein